MKLVLHVLSLDQSTANNASQRSDLGDDGKFVKLTLWFGAHLDCAIFASNSTGSFLFKIHQAMEAAIKVPATTQLTAIAIFALKSSPAGLFLLMPAPVALEATAVATDTPEGWTVADPTAVTRDLVELGLDNPMVLAMRLP